jgi:hypothetical protein
MIVNGRWERVWKEVIKNHFKVLSYYLPGETDWNHEDVNKSILQAKILFPLLLIWSQNANHSTDLVRRMEVYLHSFLNSSLDRYEWSASISYHFPRDKALNTHWTGSGWTWELVWS